MTSSAKPIKMILSTTTPISIYAPPTLPPNPQLCPAQPQIESDLASDYQIEELVKEPWGYKQLAMEVGNSTEVMKLRRQIIVKGKKRGRENC